MNKLEIIILAAGKGARMSGEKPKVLTDIGGRPMLSYLLSTVKKVHINKPIIVLGHKADEVKKEIGEGERYILQTEQLGTGHAVQEAVSHLLPSAEYVMVLYGDHPLISPETITKLYDFHLNQDSSPVTLGTVVVPDFTDWKKPFYDFGRIIRDKKGTIIKNIEKKDATSEELETKELNPSYFCFDLDWLKENIKKIDKKNAQGEYYLTDLIGMAKYQGYELNSFILPTHEALGVNTPEQLALVTRFIQ
jgi:bifunctional UDP-N-acetylglucosamine pyrophosphorylase / glucosamine-1-phosphate N-acetyltransferase